MFDIESPFEVRQRLNSNLKFVTSLLDDYHPIGNGEVNRKYHILL